MAFDFSDVLKGMKTLDEQEQIEYISLDLIDKDEKNFYSMDGVEDLAGNIETVGLQQPLRVRSGEGDHVTIVSGHRRREACLIIRASGNPMFDKGVPCIRERGDANAQMRELQLIFANSNTRVLTGAEISRQAERVTELLYELEEQGFEFTGRMRDHVAQAVNTSKSRLSRLHAIREHLVPVLLEQFDSGKLNETTAYELQKLPAEAQTAIAEAAEKKRRFTFTSYGPGYAAKYADKYMEECECPAKGGAACGHHIPRFVYTALNQIGDACNGGCCLDCYHRASCKQRCQAAAEKVEREKVEAEKRKAKEAKAAQRDQEKRYKAVQAEAKLFLPLIEAAGLAGDDRIPGCYQYGMTADRVRRFAEGDFKGFNVWFSRAIRPTTQDSIIEMCEGLKCSPEFVLGLTDDPTPVSAAPKETAPTWRTGDPPREGWYCCWAKWNPDGGNWDPDHETLYWSGAWFEDEHAAARCDNGDYHVFSWYPVPAPPEEG